MTPTFFRRAAAAAVLVASLPVLAAALKTDVSKSSVSAVSRQMSVPVEAKFKRFSAQIDYDAASPERAKAVVEIDVASFDLGDPDISKEALKKEWFDAARFPKASFVSTALKPVAAGKLEVSGKLSIKGVAADVRFPLSVKQEGSARVFEGTLPIKRLAFNIGEGEWKDTSMVADEVLIKFRVIATQ